MFCYFYEPIENSKLEPESYFLIKNSLLFMKQSGMPPKKETKQSTKSSIIESKQNENRLAVVIIFIAVVCLILFSLQ
jgi:hypothetical protein